MRAKHLSSSSILAEMDEKILTSSSKWCKEKYKRGIFFKRYCMMGALREVIGEDAFIGIIGPYCAGYGYKNIFSGGTSADVSIAIEALWALRSAIREYTCGKHNSIHVFNDDPAIRFEDVKFVLQLARIKTAGKITSDQNGIRGLAA